MHTRTIVVEGVAYVRSRDAARAAGISPDYASRLARSGQVAGQQSSGHWFVDIDSLKNFLAEQDRRKATWRALLSDLRRDEQRRAGHPSAVA